MNARPADRRRIDIYFVLYLVALVLLLPDRAPIQAPTVDTLAGLRLELQPQNVRLQQTVRRDTNGGVTQTGLDSTNLIKYIGDVEDLRVQARIEDVQTGQTILVQSGESENGMFTVEPRADSRSILFRWRPSLMSAADRTFRVTIEGSGTPVLPDKLNGGAAAKLPSGIRVSGTTQFVLATVVESDRTNTGTTMMVPTPTLPIPNIGDRNGSGEFWIGPARDKIMLLATKEWVNKIMIGGADPSRDLASMPRITLTGADIPGGIESSFDATERTIILKGKTPRSGVATIEIMAKRRDGQTRSTSFTVSAEPLPQVNLPTELFPGIEYTFATNLPDVPNVKAMIREGQAVRVETTGDVLRFTPNLQDTSKVLSFERYVDSQREGLVVSLPVRSFPAPEIADVKDLGGSQKKRVIVIFSGDKERNRPQLVIVDGNASNPKKLYGNLRPVNPSVRPVTRWYEEFDLERKDPSKPFTFKFMARDARGFTSKVWTVE